MRTDKRDNAKRSLRITALATVALAGIALGYGLAPHQANAAAAAAHPDFSGTYMKIKSPLDMEGKYELTPEGQKIYARNQKGVDASDPEIDTALKCQPQGVPRTLNTMLPFVIMQTPKTIGMVWENFMQPRLVRVADDFRPGYWNTYMGDAKAHFEGDNLVIDTIKLLDTTFVTPRGLPHSKDMKVHERLWLTDGGKMLHDEVTLDDPKIFKAPWKYVDLFERRDDLDIVETVCENQRIR